MILHIEEIKAKMSKKFTHLNGNPGSIEERKKRKEHVKGIIVKHPNYEKILEEITETHLFSEGSEQPECLFLFGETGVGKTTLLKEYRDKYQRYVVDGYTKIPVLYVKVPVKATPKSLASKVLLELGDPNYDRGTETNMSDRLHLFIHKCDIQMIIFDEFQHLIDSDTEKVLRLAADWVKSFTEDVKIPVILCGMPESEKIFSFNNGQLDRRYCKREEMNNFKFNTKEEQIKFRAFLNNIDEQLPFQERANIAGVKLAEKLFYASMGNPFYLMKTLQEATVIAVKHGKDLIQEEELYLAFDKITISKRPFVINPFNDQSFNLWDAMDKEERAMSNSRKRNKKTG